MCPVFTVWQTQRRPTIGHQKRNWVNLQGTLIKTGNYLKVSNRKTAFDKVERVHTVSICIQVER